MSWRVVPTLQAVFYSSKFSDFYYFGLAVFKDADLQD